MTLDSEALRSAIETHITRFVADGSTVPGDPEDFKRAAIEAATTRAVERNAAAFSRDYLAELALACANEGVAEALTRIYADEAVPVPATLAIQREFGELLLANRYSIERAGEFLNALSVIRTIAGMCETGRRSIDEYRDLQETDEGGPALEVVEALRGVWSASAKLAEDMNDAESAAPLRKLIAEADAILGRGLEVA